jgi:catechol 2,3-dioxygenase-like lactoylglutathione lyase family enzyme
MIFDHIGIGVSNLQESKAFFCKSLASLGIGVVMEVSSAVGLGKNNKPSFWLGAQEDKLSPLHIAFIAENREQVNEFYRAAIAAGGTDNGPPGIREHYHPNYYAAFVISPDGHNVEVVCHQPET